MTTKRPLTASVVLVVEDDELVRLNAVEMLLDCGLDVMEAVNADEAWGILLERRDIGTVFSDIDMPGSMCGVTLARRIDRCWPEIRIVLTSGRHRFADREIPDHGKFVPKPYSTAQVLEAIGHAA